MPTGRRSFLRGLAALTAGGASVGARLLRADERSRPTSDAFDMSWKDRLVGPYRAVFDCPDIAAADQMWRAKTWREELGDVYGAAAVSQAHAIVVVRHRGIPLIMDEAFWTRHDLAKKNASASSRSAGSSDTEGAREGDTGGGRGRSVSVEGFLKDGGMVLACNLAFGRMVALESAMQGGSREEARDRTLAHLIPGVVLQPSGFFGALEAQRAGCAFFPMTT